MASDASAGDRLSPGERERLAAIRGADSLAALGRVVGTASDHDAYAEGKREWRALREKELPPAGRSDGFPATTVTVGDHRFHVHGITHADTDAERAFVREHVRTFLDDGATVYAEQGIRPMYLDDLDGVCEMDDYRWAMARCAALDVASHLDGRPAFDSVGEELDSVTDRFREAVFSLIDGGDDPAGPVRDTVGALASTFLTSHESMATGEDYRSFALARRAAADPAHLGELQRYYRTAFLPQPLEREWLRRHDPELELLTHARNERQADYAVYHNETATDVHLVVGAAHQPGVAYYLRRHRDGHRSPADYEPVA